jgi:hypothetical protein
LPFLNKAIVFIIMDYVNYINSFVIIIVHHWILMHFTSINVTPKPIHNLRFFDPLSAYALTNTTCHYSLPFRSHKHHFQSTFTSLNLCSTVHVSININIDDVDLDQNGLVLEPVSIKNNSWWGCVLRKTVFQSINFICSTKGI